VTLSRRTLRKKTKGFLLLQVVTHVFTPDLKNTNNFIARDRFLVPPLSVKFKVRFALSVQLYVRKKEQFYAKVFIQLDDVVLHSLVVPNLLFRHGSSNAKGLGVVN